MSRLRLSLCIGFVAVGLQGAPSLVSPFMPEGGAAASSKPAVAGGPIEFCGVIKTETGELFGLYEPAKQKGVWLALNQSGGDILAKAYDASKRTLTIETGGQTQTLAMKEVKSDVSAPPPIPSGPGPAVATAYQPGNGSPADEAARLQAVAEEVKRRRALRQAAGQPQGGPPPPALAPKPIDPR